MTATPFIPGLELARAFYQEAVRPLIDAAFPGLVACQKGRAVQMLTAALTGKDRTLQSAAIRCARSTSGSELTRTLAAQVPTLPADVQVQLIDALGDRGDSAALAAVTAATSDKMPPAVQLAAIAAMGKLGTSRSVGILARFSYFPEIV